MWTIILIMLGVVVFALFAAQKHSHLSEPINPYSNKKPLTPTEALFYARLVEALPECVVLPQVQLSSFIRVDRFIAGKKFYEFFNPIAQQSVDYLICLKDFTVVAAVELDDKSHASVIAQQRDIKKTNNLKAADVPLLRWHAESMPTADQIRAEFSVTLPQDNSQNTNLSPWVLEEREAYFNRQRKATQPSTWLIPAVLCLGFTAVLYLGLHDVSKSFRKASTPAQFKSTWSSAKTLEEQLNARAAKMEAERQRRLEEHQARFSAIQAEEQKKLEANRLAKLKEDAWQDYYKKSQECRTEGNLITCGNEYARARKEFETSWEAANE